MANAPVPLVSSHSIDSGIDSFPEGSDLFGNVAMGFLDAISRLAQALAKLMSDHHTAMVTAGAAEGNSQVALAFVDIVRKKVYQQIGDPLDELLGLWKRPYITRHAGVLAGQFFEGRNVVGIGQEAHIKHQV